MTEPDMPQQPEPERHLHCRRCNRALKNPKWQYVGLGPICFEKERYARIMAEARQHGWRNP